MTDDNKTAADLIIAENKEEWGRLMFLLKNPEPSIFWINCDTDLIKKPLHDAVSAHFPQLKPYDIYVNEKTESLTKIILWEDKDKIPQDSIIHIFGMEDAVKNVEFLGNVNFQRDSLFRKTPATIIFWTDFATGTVLTHKAYDFWSWVFFTFDFTTPAELLTARQRGFKQELQLEDITIQLPHKDNHARIKHLEAEWDDFLKSVNSKPSTKKQMKDAVTIARALAIEYEDEGKTMYAANILQKVLELNIEVLDQRDKNQIGNDLVVIYRSLGDLTKAKQLGEQVFDDVKAMYSSDHYGLIAIQSNLALVYQESKDLNGARELLEQALYSAIKNLGVDHFDTNILRSNLGLVYRDLGNLNKAKELLEQALDNSIKTFGIENVNVALRRSNLATVYRGLGELNKAKEMLEQALESDIKNFGQYHRHVANRYYNLSYVYHDLQEIQKAKEYMQQAYDIMRQVLGENHPKTQASLTFLQKLENESRPTS